MKKTFVIISVSDRVTELNNLLQSIADNRRFDGIDVSLCFQDNLYNSQKVDRKRITNLYIYPTRLGCHAARVQLLRDIAPLGYDVFINLDDDMLLTEYTNYDRAIQKALEPDTGFVLTNWAKTRALMDKKVPAMREEFKRQVLVYNGGGMVYSRKIADLMQKLPMVKATFDNAWALTAYVQGYKNYRYMGSLAVHMICSRGGMGSFMTEEKTVLTHENLINYRTVKNPKGKGRDICIPLDSDLKPACHLLHRENNANILKQHKFIQKYAAQQQQKTES